VFKLSPPKNKGGKWTEHVLHSIAAGTDGANPNGGLVLDSAGDIFGTTVFGGSAGCQGPGCGTAFELKKPTKTGGKWTEKMLHVFTDGDDGAGPNGGLVFDSKGRLYGTAGGGGGSDSQGVVFRLTPEKHETWSETILHPFTGFGDAPCCPVTGLTFAANGEIYGASLGGKDSRGVAFRLSSPRNRGGSWSFEVTYSFKGMPDAGFPEAHLVFDKAGAVYSTTVGGGTAGAGTVFELEPQ